MGAPKNKIEIGDQFVHWLVVEYAGQDGNGKRLWECFCMLCKRRLGIVRASKLANGRSTACGSCCHIIHGLSRTVEYRVCQHAILRCTDPRHPSYPYYGGDPVKPVWVQDNWYTPGNLGVGIARMTAYVLLTIGPRPSPDHEIDRIDNAGGYTEGNLRWVLPPQNCRNRRDNRIIEWNGKSQTLIEWSEERGIPRDTLARRLDSGWSEDEALTTPVARNGRKGPRVQLREAA